MNCPLPKFIHKNANGCNAFCLDATLNSDQNLSRVTFDCSSGNITGNIAIVVGGEKFYGYWRPTDESAEKFHAAIIRQLDLIPVSEATPEQIKNQCEW